jgi:hypothetical protein
MIPESEWRWFGWARHLIVGRDCRFHLATEVGDYLISTVGDYLPDEPIREILAKVRGVVLEGTGDDRRADYMKKIGYEEIGCDRMYETMVFKLSQGPCGCGEGCGAREIAEWCEVDFARANTQREATDAHMELCRKYAAGVQEPKP